MFGVASPGSLVWIIVPCFTRATFFQAKNDDKQPRKGCLNGCYGVDFHFWSLFSRLVLQEIFSRFGWVLQRPPKSKGAMLLLLFFLRTSICLWDVRIRWITKVCVTDHESAAVRLFTGQSLINHTVNPYTIVPRWCWAGNVRTRQCRLAFMGTVFPYVLHFIKECLTYIYIWRRNLWELLKRDCLLAWNPFCCLTNNIGAQTR